MAGNKPEQAPASGRVWAVVLTVCLGAWAPRPADAQETANRAISLDQPIPWAPSQLLAPRSLSSAVEIMLLLTVLTLAPAIVVMMTCFTRIVVVLSLLRQALATQQLPPNQVLTGLALFMTAMVMAPVWTRVHREAIQPYTKAEIGAEEAWDRASRPIKRFMSLQIENVGNSADVWMFIDYSGIPDTSITSYEDVPIHVLIPGFVLSELKTAFIMGFKLYLPFLIIDMVVASVLISMGMLMLPPVLISLPFKLLLFVLADGWHLVVGTLMKSFG